MACERTACRVERDFGHSCAFRYDGEEEGNPVADPDQRWPQRLREVASRAVPCGGGRRRCRRRTGRRRRAAEARPIAVRGCGECVSLNPFGGSDLGAKERFDAPGIGRCEAASSRDGGDLLNGCVEHAPLSGRILDREVEDRLHPRDLSHQGEPFVEACKQRCFRFRRPCRVERVSLSQARERTVRLGAKDPSVEAVGELLMVEREERGLSVMRERSDPFQAGQARLPMGRFERIRDHALDSAPCEFVQHGFIAIDRADLGARKESPGHAFEMSAGVDGEPNASVVERRHGTACERPILRHEHQRLADRQRHAEASGDRAVGPDGDPGDRQVEATGCEIFEQRRPAKPHPFDRAPLRAGERPDDVDRKTGRFEIAPPPGAEGAVITARPDADRAIGGGGPRESVLALLREVDRSARFACGSQGKE